jgi:hypothetical protein
VGSEVHHLVALLAEQLQKVLFQVEAGVISADGDS